MGRIAGAGDAAQLGLTRAQRRPWPDGDRHPIQRLDQAQLPRIAALLLDQAVQPLRRQQGFKHHLGRRRRRRGRIEHGVGLALEQLDLGLAIRIARLGRGQQVDQIVAQV